MRGDRVFIASGLCTSMLVSSFNNLAEGSCRNSEHTWNGYSYCHVQNALRKKRLRNVLSAQRTSMWDLSGFFLKNTVETQIFIYVRARIPINTYVQLISMSTSERLSRLDLQIHEVGH
jgi:hypothetical protein